MGLTTKYAECSRLLAAQARVARDKMSVDADLVVGLAAGLKDLFGPAGEAPHLLAVATIARLPARHRRVQGGPCTVLHGVGGGGYGAWWPSCVTLDGGVEEEGAEHGDCGRRASFNYWVRCWYLILPQEQGEGADGDIAAGGGAGARASG